MPRSVAADADGVLSVPRDSMKPSATSERSESGWPYLFGLLADGAVATFFGLAFRDAQGGFNWLVFLIVLSLGPAFLFGHAWWDSHRSHASSTGS